MIVVFSGYNQRAVVAFLRTLEKKQLQYQIIAADAKDQVFLTPYKEHVVYTRKIKQLDLKDIIIGLKKVDQDDNNIIAPSTEALNRFLLDNREQFEALGFTIPLVKKDLYEEISDKEKFENICKKDGILVPREYELKRDFSRPLVAKPKAYVGSKGEIVSPIFILSQTDQQNFTKNYIVEDFTYQEYLEGGRSVYLLFYFDKNGDYWLLSQENFVQQPGGKSMQCAVITDDYKNEVMVEPYVKLFRGMKFRGMVMVEIKVIGDDYYMIEANPRFWGPSQLFCDAGCNLFEYLLYDYGVLTKKPHQNLKHVYYYWSNGIPAEKTLESNVVVHGDGKKIFSRDLGAIKKMEIYNRKDTKEIYKVERLKWLYNQTSKHSNYQVLPEVLSNIIGKDLVVRSRFEKERLEYINKNLDIRDKRILDIGGNTGFFTIQSIMDGAKHVDYYEGNKVHADFVQNACELIGIDQKVTVFAEYYDFEQEKKYDLVYNLNVLHHMGDDFGAGKDKTRVKKDIIDTINGMATTTKTMVFQLGFNWKGNPKECLFADGTKKELIDYIQKGTRDFWKIRHIGIAEKGKDGKIVYKELDDNNIRRQDDLGEFLNRPLFIMESLK